MVKRYRSALNSNTMKDNRYNITLNIREINRKSEFTRENDSGTLDSCLGMIERRSEEYHKLP